MASTSDFCFVHAADLHLDTPFKGIHQVAPAVAAALREASLQAFDAIVQLALDRKAAFVVIAGDVYDGADRGIRAQLRFRDGLAKLATAGIPSFVVHGNHDPVTTGWTAVRSWPEGVTVFGSDDVTAVEVVREGTTIAVVQGISYGRRDVTENLALRFRRPDSYETPAPELQGGVLHGGVLHVGVLHCNVHGASPGYADYAPCTIDDLRSTELDYWALGHIHQHTVLSEGRGARDPWIVYAGNSQARSPRASERGTKGAVVAHVQEGRIARVEHVACDSVRFAEIEYDVSGLTSLDEIEDQLLAQAFEAAHAADGRALVLRASLSGRSHAHVELARPGAIEGLLAHLRDAVRTAEPFLWWDGLTDQSARPIDLDAARSRGDFTSDLLALADSVALDDESATLLIDDVLGAVPRALAAELGTIMRDPETWASMIATATSVALDELSIGEQ